MTWPRSNVGTWSAWLVERRSWHANVRPTLGQREQPNRWVDMVGPMLARRMIFDGEMCSRLANVGIWPLTNRRPRVVGSASVLGRTLTYSIVCRFEFIFINTFIWIVCTFVEGIFYPILQWHWLALRIYTYRVSTFLLVFLQIPFFNIFLSTFGTTKLLVGMLWLNMDR